MRRFEPIITDAHLIVPLWRDPAVAPADPPSA